MATGETGPGSIRRIGPTPVSDRDRAAKGGPIPAGWLIETIVSPFHCLYQDALHFH